mmetsp:Transcript_29039/g.100233  ORF Transcript_29039/g.100233 Transcript_29039/m.100233 type:complete len:237 (+) Transcript_29039:489-1199(+)
MTFGFSTPSRSPGSSRTRPAASKPAKMPPTAAPGPICRSRGVGTRRRFAAAACTSSAATVARDTRAATWMICTGSTLRIGPGRVRGPKVAARRSAAVTAVSPSTTTSSSLEGGTQPSSSATSSSSTSPATRPCGPRSMGAWRPRIGILARARCWPFPRARSSPLAVAWALSTRRRTNSGGWTAASASWTSARIGGPCTKSRATDPRLDAIRSLRTTRHARGWCSSAAGATHGSAIR